MFCERCGYIIDDGETVCSKCGTPVNRAEGVSSEASDANAVPGEQVFVSSAYTVTEPSVMPADMPKPKKKFNVAALIIGIVAAFGVLAVIIIAVNFPLIDNAMHRAFSSPEGYYKYVEKKKVEEWSSIMGDWYESHMSVGADNVRTKQQLSVKVNEAGQSVLSVARLLGLDATWFESAAITIDSAAKGDYTSVAGSISLNEQNLISGNMIADLQNENIYFQIPEWTDTYMGVALGELEDEESQDAMEEFREQLVLEEQLMQAMPDKKTVEKLIHKYLFLVADCAEDVTKNKDTLEVNGVSQRVTVLTVTMDAEAIQGIWETVFEEIKNDKDIRQIIVDIASVFEPDIDEDEAYEAFLEELESEVGDFDEYFFEYVRKTLVMTLYVDNKGKICGRDIQWIEDVSLNGNEWVNSVTVSMRMPERGNQFGYELEIFEDMAAGYGSDMRIKISGGGKRKGNSIDGDFIMSLEGINLVDITLKDFDTKKMEEGKLDGTVEFKLEDTFGTLLGFYEGMSVFEEIKFVFVGEAKENDEKVTFDFIMQDESLVTITASSQTEKKADITIPSDADTIMVKSEDDIQKWLDEIDWDEVISRLEETDLPDSAIYLIEDFIEEMQYSGLDDMLPDMDFL